MLMQPPTEARQASRHLVRELLNWGTRFRQVDKVDWVEAPASGDEAVLRVLLADAEASGDQPDAGGHPDERVLDAWLLFESDADISPRWLARYIRMLIDGCGFALPADAMALATRAGVREALSLLRPHLVGRGRRAPAVMRGCSPHLQ